jgi:signal transduction histidine kinase
MGAAGALNENQTHFLDIVKSNTERLNILVNDLLDISRIEAGRVTLSIHPVDLHEVADEVVADLIRRSKEENKPMQVTLEAATPLPRVLADPERIRQILGNLMDNAYNYTPAEGQIIVSLHQDNGDVQVDVKDSGIGIAPEQKDRVFERFYRGEDPLVLATPGTGLGLSIVKQLVIMHHGEIWMDSFGIPGQGSTFSFTIPAVATEE